MANPGNHSDDGMNLIAKIIADNNHRSGPALHTAVSFQRQTDIPDFTAPRCHLFSPFNGKSPTGFCPAGLFALFRCDRVKTHRHQGYLYAFVWRTWRRLHRKIPEPATPGFFYAAITVFFAHSLCYLPCPFQLCMSSCRFLALSTAKITPARVATDTHRAIRHSGGSTKRTVTCPS